MNKMDIQKEREAFENHLKKMGKTDNETFSKNEDDSYQMDIIHFGWKIWQAAKAQAVPDGFVLMPKEPTKEIVEAFWNSWLVEKPYAQTMFFAYKAMIEAQD